MTAVRQSRSVVLDTQGDQVTDVLYIESLQFQITGGAMGEYWEVTDGNGDIQGRGFVERDTQNIEMLPECRRVRGLIFSRKPMTGTSVIYARLK